MPLQEYNTQELRQELEEMNRVEIAEYLTQASKEERLVAITLIDKADLADAFAYMDPDLRADLLESVSGPEALEIFNSMDSDEAVDTLQELPSNMVIRLLADLPPRRRELMNKILRYPENSVGSIMNVDYVNMHADTPTEEALRLVRKSRAGAEHLQDIFITSQERELIGVVHLADLIRHEEDTITSLINWSPVTIGTRDKPIEAAELFREYRLLALPVHDSENKLVGVVTADDIYPLIQEEVHDEYARSQGIREDEEDIDYLDTTVWSLFRQRIGWLLILMIGATFTGWVIQSYESVLEASVVLAAYIPMLMDSGGNAGSQSSTSLIRALALGEVRVSDYLTVMFKELRVGVMVGIVMSLVNLARIMLMDGVSLQVGLTVSFTLILTIMMAKFIGGGLPLLAEKFNLDPAVMAGPLITTVVDTFALIIYFKAAQVLLGL